MTTSFVEMTSEARDLSARAGLTTALDQAIRLIQEHFPESDHIDVQAGYDPDEDSEYLVVAIRAFGTPEILLDRDLRFIDAWNMHVPWPAVDKVVVRLIPA